MSPIWQMCDGGYAITPAYLLCGSLWTLPVRISSCVFPDVQSILHCRCFYPLLRWKRWMSLFHCSSLATASSPLAHSLPSSLSLYCFFSPFPLISLSLSLHTTPPPCMLPHSCSYCALLLTYALLPSSLPPCPTLSIRSELWTIFVTFLCLFPHGPGGAASLFCSWVLLLMVWKNNAFGACWQSSINNAILHTAAIL